MKPTPRLIKALDPADLLAQAQDVLQRGEELYQPLFVSHEGLLCQPVIAAPCMYEYKLVVADDLDDLEKQIQNLTLLNFDPIFNVVLWNGKYLQWMTRMNETGITVRDAIAQVFTPSSTAKREEELQLVEDVRGYLRIPPLAAEPVHFPFRLS